MAAEIEEEYEQVIDAFATDDAEMVHVVQDEVRSNEFLLDNQEGYAADTIENDDETAILVPPLLTTGKDQERISISVNEMKRRLDPPESLCTTNLLQLLHLSKKRIPDVKETLAQYGLTDIAKRSAVVSLFTKLSEMEASHLAEDYYFLTSRSLVLKEIGENLARESSNREQFESQANDTKLLLEQILNEVETKDTYLNLATHGFSPLIIRAVIDIIAEILTPKIS